jgi:hypothetical protein
MHWPDGMVVDGVAFIGYIYLTFTTGKRLCYSKTINYICNMVLSTHDTNLLRQYFVDKPVKRVYLFGSYARNTAVKGTSDIDIMLELDYSKPIGMKFFSFQRELEDLLHNKVDVVTSDGLSKYVLPYIEKDKILIYESTPKSISRSSGK